MSLDATILVDIIARETVASGLMSDVRVTPRQYSLILSDGTGANQAQIAWSDSRTLASGSASILLTSISDTRYGNPVTVNFSAVKCIYIKNTHATYTLSFTGAFTASIKPGGVFVLCDPSAAGVPGSTLSVSSTTGATFDIVVIGEGTVT